MGSSYIMLYVMKLLLSIFMSSRWRLLPRVLRDVSKRDLTTTVLGHKISFPVCIAPTAMHRMAHPNGEVATAIGMYG